MHLAARHLRLSHCATRKVCCVVHNSALQGDPGWIVHRPGVTRLRYCEILLPLAMDIFMESWLVIPLGTVFPRTPPPGTRSPLYSAVGYTDTPVLHHAALMCTAIKHCQLHALISGQPAGPYRVEQMDALACGTITRVGHLLAAFARVTPSIASF